MVRTEHYSRHDDPHNYFQRLQSYSSSRPSFSRPTSHAQWSSSTVHLQQSPQRSGSPERHEYGYAPSNLSPLRSELTATASVASIHVPRSAPNTTRSTPRSPPNTTRSSPATPANTTRSVPRSTPITTRSVHSRTESTSSLWPKLHRERYHDEAVQSEKGSEKSGHSLRSEYLRQLDDNNEREDDVKSCWSRWHKIIIILTLVIGGVLGIIIGIVTYLNKSAFSYSPSTAQVTNTEAFSTGGATHKSSTYVYDGIGSGQDEYTYYTGDWEKFPSSSSWISFASMWDLNAAGIAASCKAQGYPTDNTASDTQAIYTAIQNRANASLVDHRFILAVILQESHGCVHIKSTRSSGGVANPGLMQSHNGHSFSPYHAAQSILAMVGDGTQGTASGAGLVQMLNQYGNPYSAARGYNSGYVPPSGDLSEAAGATACYVSDVANRLTGWVNATSTCPGDDSG